MNILGLKRGTVALHKHNKLWKELFKEEKDLLLETFPGKILEVSHGGSTAVPGIPAKPIIDMFAVVDDLLKTNDLRKKLEELGYNYRGEEGAPGRILYAKGPEELRTHHLNLVEKGNVQWNNHLLIREYYLAHPEIAADYANLKTKLAKQFPDDRKAYGAGKNDFILDVIAKAKKELRN